MAKLTTHNAEIKELKETVKDQNARIDQLEKDIQSLKPSIRD